MKVNEKATNINFGGILIGQGTVWFDNFEIIIDGKKFIDLNPKEMEPTFDELQNSAYSKWLLDQLLFRTVGAAKMDNEFFETDLTADFDLIIFINESTHSKLLE
jgi:hypothetical protein